MRQPYATSTGSVAIGSVGQTISLECAITAVELISNGTNAANLQVYDGTSASGVLVADIHIPASTAAPTVLTFNTPVYCNLGAFTAGSGTGATFIIHYIVI